VDKYVIKMVLMTQISNVKCHRRSAPIPVPVTVSKFILSIVVTRIIVGKNCLHPQIV